MFACDVQDLERVAEAYPRCREVPVPMRLDVREVERVAVEHPEPGHVEHQPHGNENDSGRDASEAARLGEEAPETHGLRRGEHFDRERNEQQHPFGAGQRGERADEAGDHPLVFANVIERGDRQSEEERFGIDGREKDRSREDRDVKDRAARDGARELVLDEFIEVEQAEEKRGVRNQEAGDERAADEPRREVHEQRIEREKRHIGAVVTALRNFEVVHRIPPSPDGEQRVRRRRHVGAGTLRDDDRREFRDDDDRQAGHDERDEDFAHRVNETRGRKDF